MALQRDMDLLRYSICLRVHTCWCEPTGGQIQCSVMPNPVVGVTFSNKLLGT